MSHYADDIKRIAKQKDPKAGLSVATSRSPIDGNSVNMYHLEQSGSSGLVGPLALEILTYDDTVDIDFKDTSDTTHTLKTAATAKIIDANGDEYIIETITYADP